MITNIHMCNVYSVTESVLKRNGFTDLHHIVYKSIFTLIFCDIIPNRYFFFLKKTLTALSIFSIYKINMMLKLMVNSGIFFLGKIVDND